MVLRSLLINTSPCAAHLYTCQVVLVNESCHTQQSQEPIGTFVYDPCVHMNASSLCVHAYAHMYASPDQIWSVDWSLLQKSPVKETIFLQKRPMIYASTDLQNMYTPVLSYTHTHKFMNTYTHTHTHSPSAYLYIRRAYTWMRHFLHMNESCHTQQAHEPLGPVYTISAICIQSLPFSIWGRYSQ